MACSSQMLSLISPGYNTDQRLINGTKRQPYLESDDVFSTSHKQRQICALTRYETYTEFEFLYPRPMEHHIAKQKPASIHVRDDHKLRVVHLTHVLNHSICVWIMKRPCDASQCHIPVRLVLHRQRDSVFLPIDNVCVSCLKSRAPSKAQKHTSKGVVFWKGCTDHNIRLDQVFGWCC
jgi:hypothetical protein